jgi:DDE superfamily endonuclease
VYRMEDVLELYAEPYDPNRPVVCFDEASKELHGHVTPPIPPAPGAVAKEDYEYTRHGTANLFVAVEPLAGRRHVAVTDRRTIPDFAAQMKWLCDVLYPTAAVIRVVLDNLNTHTIGSLFATYPPAEAWRLAKRLEFHHTPKHASWLNMAECELSVLSRQCLNRRLPDKDQMVTAVGAWVARRNDAKAKILWSFRVADARTKLDHLYPPESLR